VGYQVIVGSQVVEVEKVGVSVALTGLFADVVGPALPSIGPPTDLASPSPSVGDIVLVGYQV
jgi:hypothetical protein